jgi:hypothetical protein
VSAYPVEDFADIRFVEHEGFVEPVTKLKMITERAGGVLRVLWKQAQELRHFQGVEPSHNMINGLL